MESQSAFKLVPETPAERLAHLEALRKVKLERTKVSNQAKRTKDRKAGFVITSFTLPGAIIGEIKNVQALHDYKNCSLALSHVLSVALANKKVRKELGL